jgi:hypothetical protein
MAQLNSALHLHEPCRHAREDSVNMHHTPRNIINTAKMIMHMVALGFWLTPWERLKSSMTRFQVNLGTPCEDTFPQDHP